MGGSPLLPCCFNSLKCFTVQPGVLFGLFSKKSDICTYSCLCSVLCYTCFIFPIYDANLIYFLIAVL